MAIFRSLQRIIRNPKTPKSRPFLTSVSLSSSSTPPLFSPLSRNPFLSPPFSHSRFLSPLSDLIVFQGPLFLSSTPWKLSQSATPLLVQSDVVLLPRFDGFKLLQNAKVGFPIKLGFRKSEDGRKQCDAQVNELRDGGGFVESFVNLPNFVSFSRLVSGPFLVNSLSGLFKEAKDISNIDISNLSRMIVNEWYLPAFVGLAVSGASDWLDGFLARRMGINSVVGSYLDPLADKVLVGCVALAMVEKNLLHRESSHLKMVDFLITDAALKLEKFFQWKSWYDFFNLDGTRPEKVEPLFISKVNTVFQLILVAAALLQPEFGSPETQPYITYLSWLVASTTVGSTAAYGVHHLRNRSIPSARSH
ncbi:hypothetical protein Cgig2_011223 [Carnegiea gigantea]|uniref:Cardiolipin synthase n=1 Tax=Carnegiea gigantea TaxID=171969 RepID=A0A9Q1KG32_9CARY|nr:hypothetical protein Cgig2_011223 [Carnegiea gigantea]